MKVSMYRSALNSAGYVSIVAEPNGSYVCDGREAFNTPEIIARFCIEQLSIDTRAEESVFIFALNSRLHLQGVFEATRGTNTMSLISTREIFQKLLGLNATSFAVVHNHPSGDPAPSKEDLDATTKLRQCGELLGINMIDHIIIGNYGDSYSITGNSYIGREIL